MRRLFLRPASLAADPVRIEGPDHHHLANVLRMKAGESLILLDGEGMAYTAEILTVGRRETTARLLVPTQSVPEPPIHITVAQAIGKADKFEQVVQHGTEAGASAFMPLLTERTVVQLDPRAAEEKRVRWQHIAQSAAEQCGRCRIPSVALPVTLKALCGGFAGYKLVMVMHPDGEPLIDALMGRSDALTPALDSRTDLPPGPLPKREGASVTASINVHPSPLRGGVGGEVRSVGEGPGVGAFEAPSILLIIGPEGGFSPQEAALARKAGARVVSLGPYILRSETAALVAIIRILHHAEVIATRGADGLSM